MKKSLVTIGTPVGVMLVAACAAHFTGTSNWETCFSIGAGAGIASLIIDYRKRKKLSAN